MTRVTILDHFFVAVKDGSGVPSVITEYSGDDTTSSIPEAITASDNGSDQVQQPLWTAQLRASLTQIYEKCSVQVPAPLQRPSHLRPLLAAATSALTAELENNSVGEQSLTSVEATSGPQNSESSNSLA